MLSSRRRHSRWRMYLSFLAFLGLIRHSQSASVGISESSSSAPPARRKSQDIGSLSDFTWQAWLLVDTQTGSQSDTDSATILRRITPKSIFIAPVLPACPEGYRADAMNRCVKSVNIDENAHFDFLLQRLNAIYADQDSNSQAAASTSHENDQKLSTGPLQLNIPLVADSESQSTKIELEETFPMNDPIVLPAQDEIHTSDKNTTLDDATVTVYTVKNDTKLSEKEKFFLGNTSTGDVDKDVQKPDAVVPVAEFVEETNGANFSEVVDYKIPLDPKILLNMSSVERLNVSDIEEKMDKQENTTEVSPKLVLLLSSTGLPDIISDLGIDDDLSLTQNSTADHVIVQMSNLTSNLTTKEIIRVNVDSMLPPVKKLAEDSSAITGEDSDNRTHAEAVSEQQNSKPNESQETDFIYDEDEGDEEYSYTTDVPDEEDSTEIEGEEILKHGEAGITIPTRNIERLHYDQQQQQRQNQTTNQEKTLSIRDQIQIRFNDSLSTDKDEAGSNISSEVSIDGDLILETTLLDVNTERLQITTKPPHITPELGKNNNDDIKKSTDESYSSEPEVVFSPQGHHDTTSANLHGRKQVEHFTKLGTHAEGQSNAEYAAMPSRSESLMYDPPEEDPLEEDPITEIHTIDEHLNTKESVLEESTKDSGSPLDTFESDLSVNNFKHTSTNVDSAADYVRFPDYTKQVHGYVRFPSNEANSIHSQTYKQYSPDDGPYSSTSTKSSVPVHQKPVYYLAAPSWKSNEQQSDYISPMATQRQKQRPMLLRFWTKMPLVRDPSIYPVGQIPDGEPVDTQEQPRNRFLRRSSSRKVNRDTPEILPEDLNRGLPSQKLKTPIGG